jgi:hypothetical protein
MMKVKMAFSSFTAFLLLILAGVAHGQSEMMDGDMMMDGNMMMGGWFMVICILLGILLFVALVLSILALLKYLFGKKKGE